MHHRELLLSPNTEFGDSSRHSYSKPMNRLATVPDDFEAMIRITPEHQRGMHSPTFNVIRWELGDPGDPAGSSIYVIWPDFLDEHGDSRPRDTPLPVGLELPAAMTVISSELRSYH